MKILFWTDGFWPHVGGVQTQMLRFIEAMQRKGHQYKVLAQKDDVCLKEDETYREIAIHRVDFDAVFLERKLHNLRPVMDYIEQLKQDFQPQIVHLNACIGAHAFAFLLLKSALRIPALLTVHAPGLYQNESKTFLQEIAPHVDPICCVSNWVFNEVKQLVAGAAGKLKVIYNGLPMPETASAPLSFSPPVFLLLGRLAPEKGFDTAIEAFALLKQDARLIIAGGGEERRRLESLVNQRGLRDAVEFTGKLSGDEVPALINRTSVVVVPSYYETFGLAALEAMQMGRPVIASCVGGLQEVVSDGKTGLLVPCQDPVALCTAMQALVSHPEKAVEMGARGRTEARMRFTLEQNVAQYEQIYRELVP